MFLILFFSLALSSLQMALASTDYKFISMICNTNSRPIAFIDLCEFTERQLFFTVNFTKPQSKINVNMASELRSNYWMFFSRWKTNSLEWSMENSTQCSSRRHLSFVHCSPAMTEPIRSSKCLSKTSRNLHQCSSILVPTLASIQEATSHCQKCFLRSIRAELSDLKSCSRMMFLLC